MRDILNIGKSGMGAYQEKIDVISNNVANINTEGYKRIDKSFMELVRTEVGNLGTPLSKSLNGEKAIMSSGVKASHEYRDFQQGLLMQTNDKLQLAIDGKGYFGVKGNDGEILLTRNIQFNINAEGDLVDQNGHKVETDNLKNLSKHSNGDIVITEYGEISVQEGGSATKIGQLRLFKPENEQKLISMGKNYYAMPKGSRSTELSGKGKEIGKVRQGFKEGSNVDMGQEMVELIIAQRAYQMSSKSIEAADDMWKTANNLRG